MTARWLAGLGLLAACSGCYFAKTPGSPHGHEQLDPDRLALLLPPQPPLALSSSRLIVLGRFEAALTQPVGGLYDRSEFETSPLLRTYYFKHAALELFEHACDALRATGLDVRKDYATTGEPALLERETSRLQPVIVRTQVVKWQHDQVRTDADPPQDFEVIRLVAEVSVVDSQGASLYRGHHEVAGRLAWRENLDALRIAGLMLAASLTRDAAFLRAVGARPRGAS